MFNPIYILVFILSFFITFFMERILIPFLSSKAKQPIYSEGPGWHMQKSGTPTMGGVGFVPAIALSLLIACVLLCYGGNDRSALLIVFTLVFALLNSLIGVIDDLTKLKRRKNGGLTVSQKLLLQFITSGIFIYLYNKYFGMSTEIDFGVFSLDVGIMYFPIISVMLVGAVNCCNLTDGVDGLASSVALTIGIIIFLILGTEATAYSLVSIALVGAMIAFLFYNINPARIFMGDTGSLFLGALIIALGFGFENIFSILLIMGVYIIEGISVILQVLCFKITGKRIFKMAPIHHHFELQGFGESKICLIAVILTLVLSLLFVK